MNNATGPRTEEGKAASSRNALRHGLTSAQVILPGEDPAGFEALRDSLFQAHQPADGLETVLLDQMVQCIWRLNRARRLEREALEDHLTSPGDDSHKSLDRILRYMAAIERELHRTLHDFNAMQSARAKAVQTGQKADLAARKAAARERSSRVERALSDYINAPMPAAPVEITKRTPPYAARIVSDTR